MKLSDFDYILPKELIAQEGLKNRDEARLMVIRTDGSREHRFIKDLKDFFKKGDLLILNDTRVLKAKLMGKKETGGKVDCLLLTDGKQNGAREVLIRGSNIQPGSKILFNGFTAQILEKIGGAKFKIDFEDPSLLEENSQVPLPPYIKKPLSDPERYQTVYGKTEGSLAAPTAGLHFTPGLMVNLKGLGVEFATLTLHIGLGTFAPIRSENIQDFKMHSEYYQLPDESALKIREALKQGRRIFPVGTTSIRALESAWLNCKGTLTPSEGWTEIFIYPGYKFNLPYSGLLTNFHLPKSTLLLLVSAFAGKDRIQTAYAEAVNKKYRFFSFGDAMLIFR